MSRTSASEALTFAPALDALGCLRYNPCRCLPPLFCAMCPSTPACCIGITLFPWFDNQFHSFLNISLVCKPIQCFPYVSLALIGAETVSLMVPTGSLPPHPRRVEIPYNSPKRVRGRGRMVVPRPRPRPSGGSEAEAETERWFRGRGRRKVNVY